MTKTCPWKSEFIQEGSKAVLSAKAKQRAGCKFKLFALLQPYSISANNLNYKLNTSQTIFSERELLQSISASPFRLSGLRPSPGVPLGRATGPRSAPAPRCCGRSNCGSRVSWGNVQAFLQTAMNAKPFLT